jgi:glycine betaine catabolism B
MKTKLDTVLGRLTMYRLVILALLALLAESLVLAAFGAFFFTIADMAASLAVLLAATLGSSWLFARLARVRAHPDSSVITALLLFFLFFPDAQPGMLASLAFAGVAASASKFLLAVRGRHIFNPAAVSAVLVAQLSGFLPFMEANAAAWRAATPALLPVVALGSFLVLYRSRKLALGVVAVLVSVAVISIRLTIAGTDPAAALWTSVASYPVVFLAGFMLSEPLTLPPRRWQQLACAAVVALLAFVPFQAGPLFNSPELALLAGNALAFLAGQRGRIALTFKGRRTLTPTSEEFSFVPARPVAFRPGQYMELNLPHPNPDSRGPRRVFSMTSAPGDPEVTFGLRLSEPASSFKRGLLQLQPGQRVDATYVAGDFVLPADPSRPVLLVAGGIGLTPFISQLRSQDGGPDRDVRLVYAVRGADDVAYRDELAGLGVPVAVFSPDTPELPHGWQHHRGSPTAEQLRAAVPDLERRAVYVSGSPRFVASARRELRRAGARTIRTDAFLGY